MCKQSLRKVAFLLHAFTFGRPTKCRGQHHDLSKVIISSELDIVMNSEWGPGTTPVGLLGPKLTYSQPIQMQPSASPQAPLQICFKSNRTRLFK